MKIRDHRPLGIPSRRCLANAALSLAVLSLSACAGPAMTTPIEGEPVCSDFEVGAAHTKMIGSLRFPVFLTIKSGSTLVFKTTIEGRRSADAPATRILLADDNETYTVEWALCENERAPSPAEAVGRGMKGIAKYECGKAEVYKKEELVTKKGDPKSHALTFQAPEKMICLQTVAPPEIVDAGAADASADASSEAAEDAGVADAAADGSAPEADAGSADAGSSDAAAPDAGSADAGSSDAGASKSK